MSEAKTEQVIDARAAERFEGRAPEPRPGIRSGHIPGTRNVPYNQLFDAATGTMKPLDDLRKAFTGAGVKLDAPIVTSCGSGVSAGVLTLALYRLGVTDTALYDGSWSEWGQAAVRRSRPVRPDRSHCYRRTRRRRSALPDGCPNRPSGCC